MNEPEIQTKERFTMLIGDDSYTEHRNAENSLFLFFIKMQKMNNLVGPSIDERIIDGWYKTSHFPVQKFSGADIRVVDNVEDMIKEGNLRRYDWIVSDLNYGRNRTEGGLEVFRGIILPGPIRAIFTSGDDKSELERQRRQANVDYFIATGLSNSGESKVYLLAKTIFEHYLK